MTLSEAALEPAEIADGRYVGSNTRYWLELRVDRIGSGIISGDLQFAGPPPASSVAPETDRPSFFASFRTTADCDGVDSPIEWIGHDGTAPGSLTWALSRTVPNALDITLNFLSNWAGQTAGTVVEVTVAFVGAELRLLGLQIDTEDGVEFPGEVKLPKPTGRYHDVVSVQECLRGAGIDVRVIPQRTPIARKPGGWTESDIFSELYELVRDTQPARYFPTFEIQVLALSHTDRSRLLGLSFDNDYMPRQGVAVFVDRIRQLRPRDRVERKIVATTVHEIGHALNLVHRSDHFADRSEFPSFMEYDYRYRAAQAGVKTTFNPAKSAASYWEAFSYTFEQDELRHLRHAGRTQIVPGGAAFGSVPYWQSANPSPIAPADDLHLWLTPPKGGSTFGYGQPIFLTVSLMNMSKELTVPVARHALDVKAGQLQLLVQQRKRDEEFDIPGHLAESTPFVPIMRRCFDVDSTWSVEPAGPADGEAWRMYPGIVGLGPGESLHANANLAYSSASVPVDPGDYELTPVLSLPGKTGDDGLNRFVIGAPLRIQVSPPQNPAEEHDAEILHRPDVRASLALGGSPCLQAASEVLQELRERRHFENTSGSPDPIVAILTRAAGIDQGRQGNTQEAARLLDQVTTPEEARAAFDPHTTEHTRRLADRYRPGATASKPISVVIDMQTRRRDDASTDTVRIPGFLVVQEPAVPPPGLDGTPEKGTAWGVLATASNIPDGVLDPEQNDVFAEVIVAPGDGLSQRIAASRMDIIRDENGAPAVAVLALTNPFPADRRVPRTTPRTELKRPPGGATISTLSDRLKAGSDELTANLADLAATADESLGGAALLNRVGTNAAVYYPKLEDIAFLCDWFPWCEPVPTEESERRTRGKVFPRPSTKATQEATPSGQTPSNVTERNPEDPSESDRSSAK